MIIPFNKLSAGPVVEPLPAKEDKTKGEFIMGQEKKTAQNAADKKALDEAAQTSPKVAVAEQKQDTKKTKDNTSKPDAKVEDPNANIKSWLIQPGDTQACKDAADWQKIMLDLCGDGKIGKAFWLAAGGAALGALGAIGAVVTAPIAAVGYGAYKAGQLLTKKNGPDVAAEIEMSSMSNTKKPDNQQVASNLRSSEVVTNRQEERKIEQQPDSNLGQP